MWRMDNSGHISVLLKEVLELLALEPDHIVVDATINGGGMSELIAKNLGDRGHLIGIDMDNEALAFARERLAHSACRVTLKEGNNRNLDTFLEEEGIIHVDRFLFDLGLSSRQLDASGRGFAFMRDEPLLMTFRTSPGEEDLSAERIINEWEEKHIADIIYGYGEERFARKIARQIVLARAESPLRTTRQLVTVIEKAVPAWYRHKRKHFATKTFQALRITVNDEIQSLREALEKALRTLSPKGRILVITFHSIEDRIVKNTFKRFKETGVGDILTKKPVVPSKEEVRANPRSRSAKLRVFEHF